MLDMIRAEEARQIAASANPEEAHAEADTLAENAMGWATRNAMARTNTACACTPSTAAPRWR